MAISLSKSGDSHKVSLKKGAAQNIKVNLKWEGAAAKKSGGLFGGLFGGGSAQQQDLDLGCMYETVDGQKGVIQALGNLFGSRNADPFIALDGDDRSGNSAAGENLEILRPDRIKRVVLFAYFYEGSSDFAALKTRVTMEVTNGETVTLDLSTPKSGKTFCALAQVSVKDGQIVLTKEEKYFGGHQECDANYGFGFNWTTGRK
jgi:tellurite resistance protein TerA